MNEKAAKLVVLRYWSRAHTDWADSNRVEILAAVAARLVGKRLHGAQARAALGNSRYDWSGFWPVIRPDLTLTGDISEGSDSEINYNDLAMIDIEEALSAGWVVDRNEGYAWPPSRRLHAPDS